MKRFSLPAGCKNRRLWLCASVPGFCFALFTVVGVPLKNSGQLPPLSLPSFLVGTLAAVLLTVLYTVILFAIYGWMEKQYHKSVGGESLFSRITGSWLFSFVLILACWVPVWLAFWPGTFVADSVTQFYTYLDWVHSTHHTLIHTLLLGACMMLGIDHFEGDATMGLAIYSVVQMVLMAGILAYACRWLRKKRAPLWARICVTLLFALFPFYSLWPFSAQKDVLFGGLVLLFLLQLVDLWQDDEQVRIKPLRLVFFVVIAVLMMLFRNNGVYAVVLLIPLALIWAKGARIRLTALLAACIAVYFASFHALAWAVDAESGNSVEMLSIPLQQIGRTVLENPSAPDEEGQELLDNLYETSIADLYEPRVADPVKWFLDDNVLAENTGELLALWLRMLPANFHTYCEAFLEQNLPYYLPGSEMLYRFDLGVVQIDLYPITEYSYFPELRDIYTDYDETLTLFGLPVIWLLSDTAFQVWLCIGALGLAVYRRDKRLMTALVFLLALWVTCLLGPIAIIRYLLGFFYGMPVLLACMLRKPAKA